MIAKMKRLLLMAMGAKSDGVRCTYLPVGAHSSSTGWQVMIAKVKECSESYTRKDGRNKMGKLKL
jgi:hypothetical protein